MLQQQSLTVTFRLDLWSVDDVISTKELFYDVQAVKIKEMIVVLTSTSNRSVKVSKFARTTASFNCTGFLAGVPLTRLELAFLM